MALGRSPASLRCLHRASPHTALTPLLPRAALHRPRPLSTIPNPARRSHPALFHTTPHTHLPAEDPSQRNPSKAAIVAQLLQNKHDDAAKDAQDALSDSAIGTLPPSAPPPPPGKQKKPPLWSRIKHELQHYYHGSRLFVAETRISFRLILKMASGSALSRREHKQLVRTSADMFRLIPMSVFLVVPFMEFALPLALKIWPDMLPSTFESKFAEEEKRKKLLKVRLDMAKFLQDTVSEMAVGQDNAGVVGEEEKQIAEFGAFFKKYRATGQLAPTEEIVRVARKFDDDTIMAHMSRPQLASMCKFVGVNSFGTDDFLRYMIKKKMRDIRKDDKMIAAEGIDSLDLVELSAACSARGIRTIGVSPARMRLELEQWIDLHLNHGIPSTLLLLSRAFAISDQVPVVKHVPAAEALQATLNSLPDEATEETRLVYSEAVGAKVDPRDKLELLKKEEEMIAKELKQEADEKRRVVLRAAEGEVRDAVGRAVAGEGGENIANAMRVSKMARAVSTEGAAQVVDGARSQDRAAEKAFAVALNDAVGELNQDTASLKQLGEALEVFLSPSALAPELDDLNEIKKDRQEYREDLSLVESLVAKGSGKGLETKAGQMLGKRLDSLLKRIDSDLQEYDLVIGNKLNLLKPDEIGLIPMEQVVLALKSIKVGPSGEVHRRIEQLIENLDPDGDGMVFLSDVNEMSQKLQEHEVEPLGRAQKAALAVKSQLAKVEALSRPAQPSDSAPPRPPAAPRPIDISAPAAKIIFPPQANGINQQPPMSASGNEEGRQHL